MFVQFYGIVLVKVELVIVLLEVRNGISLLGICTCFAGTASYIELDFVKASSSSKGPKDLDRTCSRKQVKLGHILKIVLGAVL